ncbi:MAG: sulfurtransferase TusA family protein [Candidatus Omnitrophica bacterium]|nr:sulfurtransferase TusA family protein [Candidatus Omnitrophota bacterium]
MIKGYDLPVGLDAEITQLEELIRKHRAGEVSATELKAHRVPFGVYEQRQADTYMVRIRCAGGFVTPQQLESVSAIAQEYGVSDLHITSRQELQIHYVELDDIITVMRRLKEIGLSTRGGGGNTVRNIAVCDDAGIDPQEAFDVSLYAAALTTRMIAEGDSWNLPRKFKIAFSGSAEDKGYATLSDLGFIAQIKNKLENNGLVSNSQSRGIKGFRVYAAGGLGAKSAEGKLLFDFIQANEVYPVAEALKSVFFKYGNRRNKHAARLRFLWQNLGAEEFKQKFYQEYDRIKVDGFEPLDIIDYGQSLSSPGLPKAKPLDARGFSLWKTRFVRQQKQEGLFSVLIPIELGFIPCAQAAKLGRFLKSFGADVIRMTRDQNFLIRNIPLDYLGAAYNFFKETIPESSQPALYGKILSCAGAATCQLGICLSRQAAGALIDELKKSGLDLDKIGDIKINISGCPNSCGHHPAADLGFSGKALRNADRLYPAYNVFAGAVIGDGKTKLAEYTGEIPAKALVLLVKDLLKAYISKTGQFSNFREYINGEGKVDLREIILRYSKAPDFDKDKNYYFDWGADKLFSLAERKAGECSAGFFDLLEMDLNNIKNTQAVLATGAQDEREKLLGELVYYASRALLITRGLDAKNQEEVYAGFLKYFIETGLIDGAFREIITIAQHGDLKEILAKQAQAFELAKAVQALYETMDNSFNFKTTVSAQESRQEQISAAIIKDLRGVVCPLNFVKTKIELAKLKSGDTLEIWLDDGAPIENVPGSVKAEGHKIISQKRIANYWSVVINKK